MSSAFMSNNASNGPATFTTKESAETRAATLELTEPGFKYEPVFVQRYGHWRIAKQDMFESFIEWVEN